MLNPAESSQRALRRAMAKLAKHQERTARAAWARGVVARLVAMRYGRGVESRYDRECRQWRLRPGKGLNAPLRVGRDLDDPMPTFTKCRKEVER